MTQRGTDLEATLLGEAERAALARLSRRFDGARRELLAARRARQERLDAGTEQLDFPAETAATRDAHWRVAPIPADLLERQVEITGPAEPKMILGALASGASVFMADFEDSLSPTWDKVMRGQAALAEAARGTLAFTDESTGKRYAMPAKPAVLMARPRGLHLEEHHFSVDGRPMGAGFFDAFLFVKHSGPALIAKGSGPYLYLPKLEGRKEARLWNDVLADIERECGLAAGTVKVTVLVETLPAAFEMDEMLWELKQRIVGLNCGRWDYIFSTIKRRRREAGFVLPDRAQITMSQRFLRSYTQLLVKTCHRRGAFAMGGMSAFIPRKDDPAANERALAAVRADKEREARDGHDGTWVAHPGLVPVAREVFRAQLGDRPNQLEVARADVQVTRDDLLAVPEGTRSEQGLRTNARVGVHYLAAWLSGQGCVPIDHLMEDAATAEISRAQIWQWLKTGAVIDGTPLDERRLRAVLDEETQKIPLPLATQAKELFLRLCLDQELEEFLTLPGYRALLEKER
ncbi:MAG: malate synthase A [Deltaproteobacteria bacterium RBG_16_71_12]|nr:MAG: malate synthase A [Deltaproteobacteria bacterium RBG_16_71_12]